MADEPQFRITTTAQVERTYVVKAADKDAAHKRLRRYIEDPEMVREDLVQLLDDATKDVTPQRVKVESINALPGGPKAVDDKEAKAS